MGEIILPLFIYSDDIEVGNLLGSRVGVNKFWAIYAFIACLPPNIASQLDLILFSRFTRVSGSNAITNELIHEDFIEELKTFYEKGIFVKTPNGLVNIKLQVVLALGDNLGLNKMCGFVESFKANVYCRIFSADSTTCSLLCFEDQIKMRNVITMMIM